MESESFPLENFSFTRLVSKIGHQIYHTHRLQWYRYVLGFVASFHIVPNFGKLYWHYSTHHTPSVLPDFLAFVFSVAGRITWLFLFRNPAVFLRCKRPARAYRWTVCGVLTLITVISGLVHVWALKMALKKVTLFKTGVIQSTLAIILFCLGMGLAWWMAWTFLLHSDESDEDFEPTVKSGVIGTSRGRQELTPTVEPYTDEISTSRTNGGLAKGYLTQAFEEQSHAPRLAPSDQETANVQQLVDVGGEVGTEERTMLEPGQRTLEISGTPSDLHCSTMAKFEFMSQSQSGPHSWISHPIIIWVLTLYATIFLVLLPIWIHEDRLYRLRPPSPTLKRSLYLPLGMYLLCFYCLKHRLRTSLFKMVYFQPPQPWKMLLSILPSWVGTGGTFRNLETGEITPYDPRRRAFPSRAYHEPALVHTDMYLTAYNANPGTCETYWGHRGRRVETGFRFRPTINRVGFVLLSFCLTLVGFWYTVSYDLPSVYKDILENFGTITREDIDRGMRILYFWQGLAYAAFYALVMTFVLSLLGIGSTLVCFFRAVWKYVPKEDKERVIRETRERMIRDGTIRASS